MAERVLEALAIVAIGVFVGVLIVIRWYLEAPWVPAAPSRSSCNCRRQDDREPWHVHELWCDIGWVV